MRQRGSQMVPEITPPAIYGIDAGGMNGEEYCARVLDSICTAAAEHLGEGGLAVNYRELPDAMWSRILPHFGVTCDEQERTAMSLAARQDAKAPEFTFASDGDEKRRAATDLIRSLAERHLGAVYRRLEALRGCVP